MKADNESRQEVKSLRQCGQRVVVQVEALAKSVEALRETTNVRIDALEKVADERAANTDKRFDEVKSELAETRKEMRNVFWAIIGCFGTAVILLLGFIGFILFGYPG